MVRPLKPKRRKAGRVTSSGESLAAASLNRLEQAKANEKQHTRLRFTINAYCTCTILRIFITNLTALN